jgi:hypothetical protein
MKLFIQIFLIALLSLSVNAQTPDYFGNDPSWLVRLKYDSFDTGDYIEFRSYSVKEDQTYAGYYQISSWYERDFFHEDFYTEGSSTHLNVRQEGRAIYYYDEISHSDKLYISYDLEIGDTVKGKFGWAYEDLIVYSIDSVLVGDSYRKIFHTDDTPETGANNILIEGIGFQYAPEIEVGNYFAGEDYFGNELQYEYALNCYGEFNIPLWSGYDEAECNLTLTIKENQQTSLYINLYPNPAVDLINFAAPSDIKNIIIYNLAGGAAIEISVNDKTGQINLTDFSRGIYIAKITMEDGILLRKKIVLQ